MSESTYLKDTRASSKAGIVARLVSSFTEAMKCFALGLREAIHPSLAFLAIGASLFSLVLWACVLGIWWTPIWAATEVVSNVLAMGLIVAVLPVTAAAGSVAGMGGGIATALLVGGLAMVVVGPVLKVIFLALLFMLLVMLTVRILLELFLMGRIQKRCLLRYPNITQTANGKVRYYLRDRIGTLTTFVFGGLLCLVVPIVGGVLFFVLASYLNVRSLINEATENCVNNDEMRKIIKEQRIEMACLGIVISFFMFIPFVGLLAPIVLGASVCHLTMRRVVQLPG